MSIRFTILGEPASKSNSRIPRIVKNKAGKDYTKFIKSVKANHYEASANLQIPHEVKLMLTGNVRVTLHIFYANERPDLDESVVLDVLQAKYAKAEEGKPRQLIRRGVYINDRQVREKHVYHGIDKANPRAEIIVEPLQPQQAELITMAPEKPAPRARRSSPAVHSIPQDREPF